jgi:hypothetical protein
VKYLLLLLAANLTLLLPAGSPLRVIGALLLIGLLPGLGWVTRFLSAAPPLLRWLTAAALSYICAGLSTLLLSYLPGPLHLWQLLVPLNLVALLGFSPALPPSCGRRPSVPLLLILLVAAFLRTANLGYSEFQGDEALVMLAAAEGLRGHEDALFLRSKGPGEMLLPMALWTLTGTINEAAARLPFTLAALLAIVAVYYLGGWPAAGFFAANGFMVAFGRIVQYQALVIWMSALAFALVAEWRQSGQAHFAALGGCCLGAGLLAHYDAILVGPAVGWFFVSALLPPHQISWRRVLRPALLCLTACLVVALPFYLPFYFDPQANRTGAYLGERIGHELRNNLPEFFHFNTFYSSSYYIIVTGLLVVGALISWVRPSPPAPSLRSPKGEGRLFPRIIWLAVPFLGYNFVVALGLTHIYTIAPAWALLAGEGWQRLVAPRIPAWGSHSLLAGLFLLSTIFLWNAFVRHDVEYRQDYPAGQLALYWTPYDEPPTAGFFGFPHRAGWKAIGQTIIAGDYGSNEEPEVTTWYTRGAPRACDPRPEFYFLADDLVDPVAVPDDLIASAYEPIGTTTLPNGKQLRIMQQAPATLRLGELDEAALSKAFDRTATPAAFARSARGAVPVEANFGGLVRLLGYDLNTGRAYPGGRVPVTLYWQATAPLPASYQVFTHLEGEAGPVAQADGVPVCWSYPTDLWRPGQIIADQHAISLSPDTPPGDYPLEVGLYLPDTFQRLDLLDEAGNPAGTSVTLTKVTVKSE